MTYQSELQKAFIKLLSKREIIEESFAEKEQNICGFKLCKKFDLQIRSTRKVFD